MTSSEFTSDAAGDSTKLENHQSKVSEVVERFIESTTGEDFSKWYKERQFVENIRQGTPYFNGPPSQQPPERHSPSQLLRCQRKSYYRHFNAPEETRGADGIFWIGDQFESDLAVPFLRAQVEDDYYVRNSMWVDFEIECDGQTVKIRGETDPVLVDDESRPLLLTEIKSTSSITHLDSPKQYHRAQCHSYLYGLSEKYDVNLTEAIILYAERETLKMKRFRLEFDPYFWTQVLQWAATQTTHRAMESLPPANPEYSWECQYCPYRNRCGQGDTAGSDAAPKKLLPLFEYPKEELTNYLEGCSEEQLTPTTATQYPELIDQFGVQDWICESCGLTRAFDSDTIDWDGDISDPPVCPSCRDSGVHATLRGAAPEGYFEMRSQQ